jgi:hypothetical protein
VGFKLSLGLLATTLHAIVIVNTGALQCGALTRSVNTVQAYCYAGNVVVYNSTQTITGVGLIISYQYTDSNGGFNTIAWRFKLENDNSMTYDMTIPGKPLRTGKL